MNNRLMRRLLRRNVSTVQIAGYGFASFIGLAIVLTAVQFYRDASAVFGSNEGSVMQRDFLVVSKQIGIADRNTYFTPEEIADLEAQPWVDAVGAFTASRFKAAIGLEFAGRGLASETFFESIPARFFDHVPDDWGFDPAMGEDADVPIMLSRDYLSLYNFGFASTRGLPTLRESEIGMIPMTISVRGYDGRTARMRGHIAGFSSRINTIAVPEEFMRWANEHFAAPGAAGERPSRLVLEVNTPGDPEIGRYMRRHSLDIAGDKMDNSTAAYFLRMATAIVVGVGAIISVLAFFILMLSLFLLLQKNREKLHQLMLLGYSPAQVAKPYVALIAGVNTAVFVLAGCTTMLAANSWGGALGAIGVAPASVMPTLAIGAAIMSVVSAANIISVRRRVRKDF